MSNTMALNYRVAKKMERSKWVRSNSEAGLDD
jgi:hypothetical protein